jgi:hypothetical protein
MTLQRLNLAGNRNLSFRLQLILASFLILTAGGLNTGDTIVHIGQSQKFKGLVNLVTFQIEPAQNDPFWAKDGKYETYVLVTTGLQTFQGIEPALGDKKHTVSLQMIQLVPEEADTFSRKLGQAIELEAIPEGASTRYHQTPVVLFVKTPKE